MAFEKILVLDDEAIVARSMHALLQRRGYTVVTTGTIADAERLLARETFDLVFMDVRLPDGDGTQLLEKVRFQPAAPIVVMITGHASLESALNCMRAGAFDYMIKPYTNAQIEIVLGKAEHYHQAIRVARYYTQPEANESSTLLGNSAAMLALRGIISRVARTDATAFIQGESGTGKELVAAAIHQASSRAGAPFIKVNCAAISPTLIESEFFGHEKGAFTGATSRREGRFELAEGGSILLDEISEIPPVLQAKLLRVLQEREFQRVGGTTTLKVNVRVLATTNRDLKAAVARGDFREDLYYRLNVVPIAVPPLRERQGDISILSEAFIARFSRQHGNRTAGLSPEALAAMLTHHWPGNIRELQNTIERAVILTETGAPITPQALGFAEPVPAPAAECHTLGTPTPEAIRLPAPAAPVPLAVVEREHILAMLRHCDGNRTVSARLLGISLRSLRDRLRLLRAEGFYVPEA
ncbi:MAG: sigma-54 dependent transcriptional regulator [Verrucomicrobiota bacterium]|nr:sigma-54 dependent transcriptional regulator [Verrucomicrobiota bacterium]